MNIWHDINPERIKKNEFISVIEISKGSKKKYELDKETGLIILDRVLHTSTHYPANYGFIPRTYAGDLDPLDVLVLCSEDLEPLSIVKCYPIGIIRMKDEGRRHVLVVVSENILDCNELAKNIESNTGFEARANVLGHFQRGGTPTAMDRFRASVLGSEAVKYLINGKKDIMLYLSNKEIKNISIDEAVEKKVIDYKHLYEVNNLIG